MPTPETSGGWCRFVVLRPLAGGDDRAPELVQVLACDAARAPNPSQRSSAIGSQVPKQRPHELCGPARDGARAGSSFLERPVLFGLSSAAAAGGGQPLHPAWC
jgi:hypothetical protein